MKKERKMMDGKQFKDIRKQLKKVRDEMAKSIKMVGKTFASKEYNELKKVFAAFADFETQLPINVRNSWSKKPDPIVYYKEKSWFDEHVVVMGSNKKTNEIIKQKIKDDLKKSISKEEGK